MLLKVFFKCLLAVTFFSFALKVKAITNIKVGDYSLVPYFSDYITKYNVFVDDKTENVDVSVSLSEEDDFVTGIGNINVSDGINEVILKVVKKNSEILTYQINIFKNYEEFSNVDDATLSKLIINGYDINFNYETKSTESNVRITGNSNLREGKNEIRIIVTSKDKTKTNVYILYVNKVVTTFEEEISSEIIEENILGRKTLTKKETNIIIISLISICSVLIIFVFNIVFVFSRRH